MSRSRFIGALIDLALTCSPDSVVALASDDAEAVILRTLAFNLTPNQRLQLRWLVKYSVLMEFVSGTRREARCKVAIQSDEFPQQTFAPTQMTEAWAGKSGLTLEFAKAFAALMTDSEKRRLVKDLMPLVPENHSEI